MRYGFCTGFATNPLFTIDSSLEAAVASWGFDYIEYPLMSLAALTAEGFQALRQRASNAFLACDCSCNLFPASVPVIGGAVSEKQIRRYLDTAFERAAFLGVKKIIFGSAGARKLGTFSRKEADRQFQGCLHILEEYCSAYQITVLLEAIRRGEADYINTLAEAAEAAETARCEGCFHIGLMADLYHMNNNGEDPADLEKYSPLIQHIHICEEGRKLPAGQISDALLRQVTVLQNTGYHHTVSYESLRPESRAAGRNACLLLHSLFR